MYQHQANRPAYSAYHAGLYPRFSQPHALLVCLGHENPYRLAGEIVVLSVFGDESSDETKKRAFVVAGLLGDTRQWQDIELRWKERTKGKVFHAADCESRRGEFRDFSSEEECHHLHRDLTRILAESNVIGWGAAIDLGAARTAFPESLPDQPYLSCFLRVIKHLADEAYRYIPRDNVEFTFDQHPETEYNAGLLYQHMSDDWGDEPFLADKISFASRKYIGIQAADLWARELVKRFDSYRRDDRSIPRLQWHTLRSTKRFAADFICSGYFQDLKTRYESISAEVGMKPEEYLAWLKRKRRQDNQSNRITYMMEVDAAERAGKIEAL